MLSGPALTAVVESLYHNQLTSNDPDSIIQTLEAGIGMSLYYDVQEDDDLLRRVMSYDDCMTLRNTIVHFQDTSLRSSFLIIQLENLKILRKCLGLPPGKSVTKLIADGKAKLDGLDTTCCKCHHAPTQAPVPSSISPYDMEFFKLLFDVSRVTPPAPAPTPAQTPAPTPAPRPAQAPAPNSGLEPEFDMMVKLLFGIPPAPAPTTVPAPAPTPGPRPAQAPAPEFDTMFKLLFGIPPPTTRTSPTGSKVETDVNSSTTRTSPTGSKVETEARSEPVTDARVEPSLKQIDNDYQMFANRSGVRWTIPSDNHSVDNKRDLITNMLADDADDSDDSDDADDANDSDDSDDDMPDLLNSDGTIYDREAYQRVLSDAVNADDDDEYIRAHPIPNCYVSEEKSFDIDNNDYEEVD